MDNTITIPNIEEFTQQIINGNLILTRINPFIDELALFQQNLRGSYLTLCKINNVQIDIHKYKKLLIHLYSNTDTELILQHTILNILQEIKYDKGFNYYSQLALSIQGADATRTLKEIINIVRLKNFNMELKIKMINGDIVRLII